VLLAVVIVAGTVLSTVWTPNVLDSETAPDQVDPKAAAGRARDLEVIRVCLQVMGVGIVGAVLGFAASRIEVLRREQHEAFEIRAKLLERSTRCAHTMYVACQHYSRVEAAPPQMGTRTSLSGSWPPHAPEVDPIEALHAAYLTFAAEARAVQALIGARYSSDAGAAAVAARSGFPWDRPVPVRSGQSWWRWHQLYDLLTLYYFSLLRDYRKGNRVLRTNALGYAGGYHCGLAVAEAETPTPSLRLQESENCPSAPALTDIWEGDEYVRIRRFVQQEFDSSFPDFVEALRVDRDRTAG
jgi:hypothetical protein